MKLKIEVFLVSSWLYATISTETSKITLKNSILYGPVSNANRPQDQPKSHILFHRNGSPRDLYIMTLATNIIS